MVIGRVVVEVQPSALVTESVTTPIAGGVIGVCRRRHIGTIAIAEIPIPHRDVGRAAVVEIRLFAKTNIGSGESSRRAVV